MRILIAICAMFLVLAASPSVAQPSTAPDSAGVEQAGLAAGARLAGAVLGESLIGRAVDQIMPTLVSKFVDEIESDPDYRRVPEVTRNKISAYVRDGLPLLVKEELSAAATEARSVAANNLAATYDAQNLGGIADFFASPAGGRILSHFLDMAVKSAVSGREVNESNVAEVIGALSGDDIKALVMFSATPAGTMFSRDSDGIFGHITTAFDAAIEARMPAVQRKVITGLCSVLEPREARRLGAGSDCDGA